MKICNNRVLTLFQILNSALILKIEWRFGTSIGFAKTQPSCLMAFDDGIYPPHYLFGGHASAAVSGVQYISAFTSPQLLFD